MRNEYTGETADRGRACRDLAGPSSPPGSPTPSRPGLPEPNAMVLATADAQRPAERPHRAAQGLRRSAASCSSPTTSRARAETLAANPCGQPGLPVAPAAAPGGRQRRGRAGGPRARPRPYFATRPRGVAARRLGQPAVAGRPDRAALDAALAEVEAALPAARAGAPPHWGGLRVEPGRRSSSGRAGPSRLHDRLRYRRSARTAASGCERLATVTRDGSAPMSGIARTFGCAGTRSTSGRCGTSAYRRLFVGNAVSFFGFQFTAVAVPVQMYAHRPGRRSGSASLGLAGLVPLIVFALWGGASPTRSTGAGCCWSARR